MRLQDNSVDLHLGRRLRTLRLARRLSLEELGRRIGVTYQQVQKYEVGANRISAAALYRMACAFGVPPAYFFEGLEGHPSDSVDIFTDPTLLQVSMALRRIEDPRLREHLLALVEAVADSPV